MNYDRWLQQAQALWGWPQGAIGSEVEPVWAAKVDIWRWAGPIPQAGQEMVSRSFSEVIFSKCLPQAAQWYSNSGMTALQNICRAYGDGLTARRQHPAQVKRGAEDTAAEDDPPADLAAKVDGLRSARGAPQAEQATSSR